MSVTVQDKLPSFKRSLYNVLDDAIKEAAKDTLITARKKAPFKKGALRSNSEFKSVKLLHQRVSFWIEYARFQEFGGDNRKIVRRYTHSGTGKRFLKTSGDNQAQKIKMTLKKHSARARA